MANATFSHAFNMDDTTTAAGFTTVETSSLLRLEDASNDATATLRQDYGGTGFTFDGSGNVTGGTITSFTEFDRPSTAAAFTQTVSFTGLNTDVNAALTALNTGDVSQFYALFFNGSDQFAGSPENDVMNGFNGNDIMATGAGNDIARGGAGNDTMIGGSGSDTLDGGSGNDIFVPGSGNAMLLGGLGYDIAQYGGARSSYSITENNGNWIISGNTVGTDTLSGVEKATFGDGSVKLMDSIAHASGGDFNGDAHGDILWRNDDGRPAAWEMNGLNTQSANLIDGGIQVPQSWTIAGGGDFNGDGKSDILWRNDDGTPSIWLMNGLNTQGANVVDGGIQVPNTWSIAGTGDFNGDGKADILWRHDDGRPAIWLMNGLNTQGANLIDGGTDVPASWNIAGVGDFFGDGKSDILWRNDDGRMSIWRMNGLTSVSQTLIDNGTQVPSDWTIAGTGDFNGDGKADILFRNTDGRPAIWLMNGASAQSANVIDGGVQVPHSWSVAGTGDFNGDGKSDILWRNDDGQLSVWEMNGLATQAANVVDSGTHVPNDWLIA